MVSPTGRHVDITIKNSYVGTVDRKGFCAFVPQAQGLTA
jgi:hypothetical protein